MFQFHQLEFVRVVVRVNNLKFQESVEEFGKDIEEKLLTHRYRKIANVEIQWKVF